MPLRRKKFILPLQPHEAVSPNAERSPWLKTLAFCTALLFLVGLAFPHVCLATLAFSGLMTPNNLVVTRNTISNMASFMDLVEFNQTNCSSNTTSYAYDKDGNEINNLTKENESGELSFNHTGLPLAPGIDRKFTFRAHSWLDNGTELDTGNRTIYIVGSSTLTTGEENMLGEILILAGVALIYVAFRKEKEAV